ncbi:pilus assembly protein TadG-related protein [Nocardiopsis protaetiae]|uniref:pilus assembly protein TadG-related protein n=1 Tax=Nocardiopsis protaetiae TaxID=3382270 RepID=UPI00387B3DCA
MTRAASRGESRRDEGHASVFLLLLVPVLMVVFALVWEAGHMLTVRTELMGAAREAARAATHRLDEGETLARNAPVLDESGAREAAVRQLRAVDAQGLVTVTQDGVTVLARTSYTPVLLPLGPREVEAEATATVVSTG